MPRAKNSLRVTCVLALLATVAGCGQAARIDWGKVAAELDAKGRWQAVLVNSHLEVRYGPGRNGEAYIREFIIKETKTPIPGMSSPAIFDASSGRGPIVDASVVADRDDVKTVRIKWAKYPGAYGNEFAVSDVSIFPNSRAIRITLRSFVFSHLAEHPWPGNFVIYGYDKPNPPTHEKAFFWRDSHYGVSGQNAPPEGFERDPGPLDYNGHFIMGVVNDRGIGFGRVWPIKNVHTIKLLDFGRKGFEAFYRWPPFDVWLFAVTGGAEEVISVGRQIADGKLDAVA